MEGTERLSHAKSTCKEKVQYYSCMTRCITWSFPSALSRSSHAAHLWIQKETMTYMYVETQSCMLHYLHGGTCPNFEVVIHGGSNRKYA